jgi:GH15 family glucan-1,4-alpha-glucosidase
LYETLLTAHPCDSHQPSAISDYGIIGDCRTAALIGRNGSIDWLCWPRFDSPACLAAILGDSRHGRWSITSSAETPGVQRSYRGETLILETVFETMEGVFAVIDFMAMNEECSTLVRIVEGRSGSCQARMNLTLRFNYGMSIPWVERLPDGGGLTAIAGPNLTVLRTTATLRGEDMSTSADFTIEAGQRVSFTLSFGASYRDPPPPIDANDALRKTEAFWLDWAQGCAVGADARDIVIRSLLTLKALTFAETGGIVAAPTTSLPEKLGGTRNWDYRYCWLRDATLTLLAFMKAGFFDEAKAWSRWLQRSIAGSPKDFQIMYGIGGERLLPEWEARWLPGHQGASPVRIGNAASGQLQLDVLGEIADASHLAREAGLSPSDSAWTLQLHAIRHLEGVWKEPDDGIWEMRGGRKHFTHSKVMAWVAFDRSIRDAEKFSLEAPLKHWRDIREEIHREVCQRGYDAYVKSFTQSFDDDELDASLLLIPAVGFLPIDDLRVANTIAAIERELLVDGFVRRYRSSTGVDGLPSGEGAFIACSFWLADAYRMQGRLGEAHALVERLLSIRNDLGLLSEEYDTDSRQLVGNFPQAFSHLALVNTALGLFQRGGARDEANAERSTA